MMKKSRENKTATDFLVGIKNENNDEEIDSIECKTRCVSRTEEREIMGCGDKKHISINYNDNNFSDKVLEKTEAVQCLHHAAVYGFNKTLLLIGNRSGSMIKGIWMHCTDAIAIAHLSTLKTCYNLSLKWMCENENPPVHFENLAQGAIDSSFQELMLEVELCMHMLNNIKFPLPILSCIIPHVFSRWNLMKGGSDAATKLLEYCQVYLPVHSC